MAGSKTGTSTIVHEALHIAKVFQKYGASDLAARTNVDFQTCIVNLIQCAVALALTDDFLLMRDRTGPAGPEDTL